MTRPRILIALGVLVPAAIFGTGYIVGAQTASPDRPAQGTCVDLDDGSLECHLVIAPASSTAPPTTTTTVPATSPPTSATTTTPTTTTRPTSTTSSPTTTAPPPPTTSSTSPPTTAPPTTSPPSGSQFSEDFLTSASLSRFQFQTAYGTQAGHVPATSVSGDWEGDHDMSCGAPTTFRTVNGSVPSESVWFCAPGNDPTKGHVMLAGFSGGYGQVDMAPNQSFNNVKRICWDQNLTDVGGRKWTQVVVVPEAGYQANGRSLAYARNDLMPDPAHGFLSVGSGGLIAFVNGRIGFMTTTGSAGPTTNPDGSPSSTAPPIWFDFDSANGTTSSDKATRYKQCLTETPAGLHIERDTATGHRSGTIAGLHIPQGQVRVIWQDDFYDPPKGDLGDRSHGADPRTTWHIDSIEIG
jgi:hypothetical protein